MIATRKRLTTGLASLALAGSVAGGVVAATGDGGGTTARPTAAADKQHKGQPDKQPTGSDRSHGQDGPTAGSGGTGKNEIRTNNATAAWIRPGARGSGVKCVQRGVNDWAQRTGRGRPLKQDGVYGNQTYRWVLTFQGASRLAKDGIVGPSTGRSLLDNLRGSYADTCWNVLPT